MFQNIHDYRLALSEVKVLSELQPAANSPLGARLAQLMTAVESYEKELLENFRKKLRCQPYLLSVSGNPAGVLTVLAHHQGSHTDYHVTDGFDTYIMDLYTSGDMKHIRINPGDKVFVDWSHPFNYIAHGVRKLEVDE